MERIKGGDKNNRVQIGDKHLTVKNVEDITTYRIFIVDDVYEISPTENAYECIRYRFKYRGKVTQFQS